jgi:hypothetical protein
LNQSLISKITQESERGQGRGGARDGGGGGQGGGGGVHGYRGDKADADNFWLAFYVMLSRATAMDNLLIINSPSKTFLERGPPMRLRAALSRLLSRAKRPPTLSEDEAHC